jgi:hypothetical protein
MNRIHAIRRLGCSLIRRAADSEYTGYPAIAGRTPDGGLEEPGRTARNTGAGRARRRMAALTLLLGLAAVTGCGAQAASTTVDRVGVVMCSAADWGTNYQLPLTYWKQLFTPGTGGVSDYFNQVSYGHISFNTSVLGPFQMTNALGIYPGSVTRPLTLLQYMALNRPNEIATCLTAAANSGQNLTGYNELIAVQVDNSDLAQAPENYYTLQGGPPVIPTTVGTVNSAGPVSGGTQQFSVKMSGTVPAVPFPARVGQPGQGFQGVLVTSITPGQGGASNWTVTLGFQPPPGTSSTPPAVTNGQQVNLAFSQTAGAASGLNTITVGTGSNQQTITNVGTMNLAPWMSTSAISQEIAHGLLNMGHTRDLAQPNASYRDPWDPMSASKDFPETQQPGFVSAVNFNQVLAAHGSTYAGGPWFNAVDLDYNHWLPAFQEDGSLLTAHGCVSEGSYLGALSSAATSTAYLEIRLPYTQTQRPGFPSGGLYYTAEYRDPRASSTSNPWDSGLHGPGVVLHLAVAPSGQADPYISYLADSTVNGQLAFDNPGNAYGLMPLVAGSDFADAASHAYFAVNATPANTAEVTEGNCPIPTSLTPAPVSGHSGMLVTYTASLRTNPGQGPSFPIPGQQVNFTGPGAETCQATTNANGIATCTDFLTESNSDLAKQPFVTVSYNGDAAYQQTSSYTTFNFTAGPTPSSSPSPHISPGA